MAGSHDGKRGGYCIFFGRIPREVKRGEVGGGDVEKEVELGISWI